MGIQTDNQSQIAFKNLSGKSHTAINKGVSNELEGIFFNIVSSNVWMSEISATPSISVQSGVSVRVDAVLVYDNTSGGQSWFATWPAIATIRTNNNSGLDPKTGSNYEYGVGSLTGVIAGQRVINSISSSYGSGYGATVFDSSNSQIALLDSRDWIYQYNSGVYWQQTANASPAPAKTIVYYYSGDNLKNSAGAGATGATGATGSSAYDVWITNGGVGTEIDFLTSIIGATGATGSDGIMGATGATGSGDKYKTTSTTTNDIVMVGSQTYSVFVDDMNLLAYTPNQSLIITDNGNVANYMYATVTSYSKSTGELVVSITAGFGTGTGIVDWTININGGSTNIIGAAEDGDYTDGLFNDFITTTPIGTAVDRFNELLLNLVPPSAPALSNWIGNKVGGVNGKLSFDKDNTITDYINANDTTLSIPSPVDVDGDWNLSGKRLSIYSDSYTVDLTGTLNDQITINTASPTAYAAKSFGDANKGNLYLLVNGVTVSDVNLTNLSAQNVLTAGSGLNVTAATSSKFPIGTTFEQFQNRTGTWIVKSNDGNIVNGYNYVIAKHISTSPSFNRILDRFDFIIDDDSTATVISDPTVSHSFSGTKYLSGVKFFEGGLITYGAKIDNLYKNTYYKLNDAITYTDRSTNVNSIETQGTPNTTNYVLTTSRTNGLGNCSGNESLQVVLTGITFSVNSQVRRFNDDISLNLTARRTVSKALRLSQTTGGDVAVSNVYLDSYNTPAATDFVESFNDETKRLKDGVTYDSIAHVTANPWDNQQSLLTSDANHQTGLQVITGRLVYPKHDFSVHGSLTTNLNFGDSNLNYASCVGQRTYIRYFYRLPASGAPNFTMNISGSGTPISNTTNFSTLNQVKVLIKAPTQTGWMDCCAPYEDGKFGDNAGAKVGSANSFNSNWSLTIGTKNTASSGGFIVIKIIVPLSWDGYITNINFTYL